MELRACSMPFHGSPYAFLYVAFEFTALWKFVSHVRFCFISAGSSSPDW